METKNQNVPERFIGRIRDLFASESDLVIFVCRETMINKRYLTAD